MKFIDGKIFGKVIAPESIAQIIEITSTDSQEKNPNGIFMWRGQGNIDWPIHSSGYRRLAGKMPNRKPDEQDMRDYERSLIYDARHQGYGFEGGRKLSDFELLAKLQHHGAATRLLDVSRNLLVALWFACHSRPENTGMLFGISAGTILGLEGSYGYENDDYNKIFPHTSPRHEVSNTFPTVWQPPVVTKRIAAQSAQFVYSTISHGTFGSLYLDEAIRCNGIVVLAITADMKKKFLNDLERTFDIRLLTMFPDFDGFCRANSEQFSQNSNYRW